MAPGAIPLVGVADPGQDIKVDNAFEGPEKKLVVQFAPGLDSNRISQRVHASMNSCNTSRSICTSCVSRTLRGLRTDKIKAILNAARCTMLSVVSNMTTDAYLLSESSLFVTDFRITLKTCGTTTLLRALPVILRLAFETLGLEVQHVQFSRVAYLFPEEQVYPHDCFDHEVAYLDHQLATKGHVFEATSDTGSKWYLYYARPPQNCEKSWAPLASPKYMISSSASVRHPRSDRTLEMYMFDLDPVVMKQFMFHDRPSMIGSDNIRSGTTSQGIKSLLGDHDIVDGYNFAPCGYSMNALKQDSYYTIHVSPEHGASYVSFETTAHSRSFASLVTAVARLFRPGRFMVSCLFLGSEQSRHEAASKLSWAIVSKLISADYSMIREPHVFDTEGHAGCYASMASFQKLRQIMPGTTHIRGLDKHDGLERLLLSVAIKHDAYFGGTSVVEDSSDYGFENEDNYRPKYVVDLGRVARNWSALRMKGPKDTFRLRYAVQSNMDKGVLALLRGLDVDFEAADAYEIDLLASMGICRTRIVLVTPVLTTALAARFPLVGKVALFDVPADAIHAALLRSNVDIELRVVDDNGLNDLHATLNRLVKSMLNVTSIGLDTGPDSFYKASLDECDLFQHVTNLRRSIWTAVPNGRGDFALHFGDLWISRNQSGAHTEVPAIGMFLSTIPDDAVVSIDASGALLAESISLFTRVIGRRGRRMKAEPVTRTSTCQSYSYYLSDGAYGALSNVLMSRLEGGSLMTSLRPRLQGAGSLKGERKFRSKSRISGSTKLTRKQEVRRTTLYGPTCDALDCVWEGELPVLDVGDGVLFRDIGAYSSVSRTEFNGFGRRFDVSYVVAVADM